MPTKRPKKDIASEDSSNAGLPKVEKLMESWDNKDLLEFALESKRIYPSKGKKFPDSILAVDFIFKAGRMVLWEVL